MRYWAWLCKIVGHKYNDVDLIMLSIKFHALNTVKFSDVLCVRCGHNLVDDIPPGLLVKRGHYNHVIVIKR